MLILNKKIVYLCVIFLSFFSFGQEGSKNDKAEFWKKEKEHIIYQKDKKFKGPSDWYMDQPASLKEDEKVENTNSGNYNGIKYDPQKIKQNRRKRNSKFGKGGGGGGGTINYDPKIDRPNPIDFPEVDGPDLDPPLIPVVFWKILLYVLLFIGIIFLAYQVIKHKKPNNKKVKDQSLENEWNPEIISKTELELLLDQAMDHQDYRECVRIYFTFILKEIIKKGWIKWKKEKTNFDYILEMKSKTESAQFEECVRIYELIWYGEYEIDEKIFNSIQPKMLNYYQKLKKINE